MKKKIILFISICIVVVVVSICIAIFCISRSNKDNNLTDELKGLWDIDGNTKYEFDGKGNGKLIVPSNKYEFTYTIEDNILSIDFKNETSTDTDYEFKIDNDKLELTNKKETYLKFKLKRID